MNSRPELPSSQNRYVQSSFSSEASLFSILEDNRDAMFGEETLWLSRGWLFGRGAVGDLPDAFAVDLDEGTWSIVQCELSRSPFWPEVVPRVCRRLAPLENPMFRMWLAEAALAAAFARTTASDLHHRWNPARLGRCLRGILSNPPRLAVAVDAIVPAMKDWSSTLRFETRLLEITRHVVAGDPSNVCYRIPLQGAGISTISDLAPEDDALPASRFLLVQRREQVARAAAESAATWRASA